ncbi:glycosyltransferase family 4 protein [Erwiniaceae bacterium L1_54_6]|nr:glycosyltransferase family 4 protein [Erwiniaceae bacterium L1_54_6]
MKKIIMFTRSLPMHGLGGMEVVAWDIAKSLARLGCDIKIITTCTRDFRGLHVIDGIQINFIEGVRSGKYSRGWWEKSAQIFESKYGNECDYVFSVSTGAYGVIKRKDHYRNVRFVIQIHGTAWGEFLSKIRSRTARGLLTSPKNIFWMVKDVMNYHKFDKIISIGNQVSQDLEKWPYRSVVDAKKIELIRNGIDNRLFSPTVEDTDTIRTKLRIPNDCRLIVTTCRLHAQKGVANCIKTLKELSSEASYCYIVVGSGPEEENLKKLSLELGLAEKVIFTGSLKREEIAQLERTCDLFLFLTDRVEGLPLNVLEAASAGLPIVLSEQVKLFDSESITLVKPREYKDNAKIIERILLKEKETNISYLPEEYTLDFTARKYLEAINQIMENEVVE